jgi:hypothetical protein
MKNLIRAATVVLVICGLHLTLYTTDGDAAIPRLLNYQGRLTDASGAPRTGSYAMTFRLYDAETAGTLKWEELQNTVVVDKGLFNIQLGAVTALTLAFDIPYYLEIKVGDEVLTPRQKVTASGYALRAEKADEAVLAQNANAVNNFGACAAPAANKLLPLDANAKLPVGALKVYDSGWFAVGTSQVYTKDHNLGTTRVLINIMFSPSPNGTGVCTQQGVHWHASNDYGIVVSALSSMQVTLSTASNGFHTIFNSGTEVTYSSGYARIVLLALE